MGFYDEGYTSPQPKKEKSVWFVSFISSLIGAVLALTFLPFIAGLGLLPYELVDKDSIDHEQTTLSNAREVSAKKVLQPIQLQVNSEVVDTVEKVSNAIVGVINIQEVGDFWSREMKDVETGTGSGIIFEKLNGKAHIVTNYHVIQGAKKVEVSLENGDRVEAKLMGADPLTDLAVLEIGSKSVKAVAEFGDSDTIKTGEPAIAIGNPLGLEFSRTVTQGIISAKERSVPVETEFGEWEVNVIQTDAAINPGNSGGALANIKGQVIGINSLKIKGGEGMGFAIPINDAIPIINDLIRYGKVQRPYMGVELRDLTSIDSYHWSETLKLPSNIKQGVVITGVETLSSADQAGLKELDVIVELDGGKINNSMELRKYLYTKKVGDKIKLKIYRKGLPMDVVLKLNKSIQR